MAERRYSFSEIQAMRNALRLSYPSGVSYYEDQRSKEIEERVRTLMVGGVDPKEVIAECEKRMAAEQQAQIELQKRRAAGQAY